MRETHGLPVVTGIARHSLGASFVGSQIGIDPTIEFVTIDRIKNPDYSKNGRIHQVICDLNPLTFSGGYQNFASSLEHQLSAVSARLGNSPFRCLIQFAGTYESGTFLSHDVFRRKRVLGLNLLGVTEVLYAVMSLNDRLRYSNAEHFKHILIGSFQGLEIRPDRTLYAATKAYGLDLCTALDQGKEVAKCVYLAMGPVDTAMLHWNHWTVKCGGSDKFFQSIFAGDPLIYAAIFQECREDVLVHAATAAFSKELQTLRGNLEKYRDVRRKAFESLQGVLRPTECAKALSRLFDDPELESGVYALTAEKNAMVVTVARFADMSRKRLFDAVAKRWTK